LIEEDSHNSAVAAVVAVLRCCENGTGRLQTQKTSYNCYQHGEDTIHIVAGAAVAAVGAVVAVAVVGAGMAIVDATMAVVGAALDAAAVRPAA
jgi:hypothetical protein